MGDLVDIRPFLVTVPASCRDASSGRSLPLTGAVMYDTAAEIVFGPVFNDPHELTMFLMWCARHDLDPRGRTPGDLGDLIATWFNAEARYWPTIPGTTLTTPGAPS